MKRTLEEGSRVTFEGDSALIVPVPEADPVIGAWRRQHDPSAEAGVPAHVTVVYPFVARSEIGEAQVEVVRAIAAATSPFPFVLGEIRWFGDDVAYLRPDPDVVFRGLTAAIWGAFPGYPPYGGVHGEPTPHVTIGHADTGDLTAAIEDIAEALPIEASADRIDLIELIEGRWVTAATYPFGVKP